MEVALVGFGAAFALIFMRVPIALAMGVIGFLGFAYLVGWRPASSMLAMVSKDSTMTYSMVVIPLFILMGNLVAGTGISRELYRAAQSFLGARKGGLAVATVVASGGFASICGSSVATVVTMGKVAMPSMRQYGYDDRLSTASVAAGATLGILIPPSVLLVIYGIITETHIGMLYAAGLIPGLLGIVLYIVAVRWTVWRYPDIAPAAERAPWSERIASLSHIWAAVLLFAVVIGGIYSGFFTSTEAAGFGAFGALVIALARRKLGMAQFLDILVDTAETTAVLFALIIGAGLFTEFLNYSGAHGALLDFVTNSGFSPALVILVICVIYIILGMLMESISMVLLTVPLFFPVVTGLGFDPVWFGILLVILCELGLITPPIGVNLFVMRSVTPEVPISRIIRGIIPFIGVDLIRVALVALFPAIALFLPHLLF
ncbi:TRAP transporter large permease subunit [Pseudooceanicola sp. 216_PA32_1]|uniref:TRAP transporter large permease protein n=1 Tax=Pseudooceanicola pacificus TaxID=2676438 RepID=A0A844W520_9RHOB|nr:TRAP transporter large permease [Pseudooceanicola pacificus]MWB78165.1 TRAP transporter large permease subunit [Pseudooceanicola pacificus]